SISQIDKDFVKYYVSSFMDDNSLIAIVKASDQQHSSNIYSILNSLRQTKRTDSIELILKNATEIDPNNVFIFIEKYLAAPGHPQKDSLLRLANRTAPKNELVSGFTIYEARIDKDTTTYF